MTQALIITLTVLKIIGIVLLSLLGLVLLIVCIVLFWPIRYRVNADLREQDENEKDDAGIAERADVTVSVTWLLRLIRFFVRYPADPENGMISLKVAFFTLIPGKKKKTDDTPGDNGLTEEHAVPEETQVQETIAVKEEAPAGEAAGTEEPAPSETEAPKETEAPGETVNEKKPINERIDDFFEKLESASEKPEIAARKIYYTIYGTYAKIKHVRATIESRCFERAKQLLLNEVSRVIRSIMPRKTRIYVHYGADDPAKTADIIGYAGMLYPLFEERLTVVPDFDREVTGGYARIAGRIILVVPLFSFLRLFFSRDVRRIRRRFKELKELDKEV